MNERQARGEFSVQLWRDALERKAQEQDLRTLRRAGAAQKRTHPVSEMLQPKRGFLARMLGA